MLGHRSAPPAWAVAALALCANACGGATRPARPNVLLFVVDTLRADRLSCYGCPENTTPNLDAFAREGILFERAGAPSPYTVPSHASLFTSTYPAVHGIWNEVRAADGERELPRLPEAAVTLAEILRAAGYATAAIADGGWIQESRGLAQGFEHFHSKNLGVVDRVSAALEWLEEEAPADKPFFLFLHTYQIHAPYLPPPGYEERFARGYQGRLREVLARAREHAASGAVQNPLVDVQERFFRPILAELGPEERDFLRALYDAELSLVDEEFARLLGYLRLKGLLARTIVVVTSDHGEEFGEHGEFTHQQVYEECLRIPLLVWLPGGPRGVRRADPVDLVDLAPTLLEALGLEPPAWYQGRAVDLRRAQETAPRAFFAETNAPRPQAAWRRGPLKCVLHLDGAAGSGRLELYDLDVDPGEVSALPCPADLERDVRASLAAHREASARLREELGLGAEAVRFEQLPEERRVELKELGYADG